MSKIYRYEKLTYTGKENEDIIFRVKMISNGNKARTNILIPSGEDKVIINSNSVSLGLLKSLTPSKTAVYCNIENPTPISDDIIMEYWINSTLMQRHTNPIAESHYPFVILKIKFTKS